MQYEKKGDVIAARIDPGEEILKTLGDIAEKEHITAAAITAIGAVNTFRAGIYDLSRQQYTERQFSGSYEIVSLSGSITEKDQEPYFHLHIVCAGDDGSCVGGHLKSAVVSVTCEVFITAIDMSLSRIPDEKTGINIIRFNDKSE